MEYDFADNDEMRRLIRKGFIPTVLGTAVTAAGYALKADTKECPLV